MAKPPAGSELFEPTLRLASLQAFLLLFSALLFCRQPAWQQQLFSLVFLQQFLTRLW
jgi:hypothetical protein